MKLRVKASEVLVRKRIGKAILQSRGPVQFKRQPSFLQHRRELHENRRQREGGRQPASRQQAVSPIVRGSTADKICMCVRRALEKNDPNQGS